MKKKKCGAAGILSAAIVMMILTVLFGSVKAEPSVRDVDGTDSTPVISDDENIPSAYIDEDLYEDIGGNIIYVMKVNGERYLFLPNEADAANISLQSRTAGQHIRFAGWDGESDTLDLGTVASAGGIYSALTYVEDEDGQVLDSFDLKIMKGNGIGTLYYTSDDTSSMGEAWLDETRDNRGSGSAVLVGTDGKVVNKKEKNQIVTDIHGHGKSSWGNPKKGYQIKFSKRTGLISGGKKAKKWLLLAQYQDPLRINDKIIKDIGNRTSSYYSPRETWVNFYFDGEYRGIYLLSEKNEIGAGRISITDMEKYYRLQDPDYGTDIRTLTAENIYGNLFQYQDGLEDPAELGGYLLEIHKSVIDTDDGFMAVCGEKRRAVDIKSPSLSGQASVEYISDYFQEFCDAVGNSDHSGMNPETGLYYYDYCDLDSLVDTYLIQTITSEHDSYFKSSYFYKEKGEKMVAGPLWDMDLTFGEGWKSQIDPDRDYVSRSFLASDLLKIQSFRERVKERYETVYSEILEELTDTDMADPVYASNASLYTVFPSFTSYYALISDDLAMDDILWPENYKTGSGNLLWDGGETLEDILGQRVDWVKAHKLFLDSYFAAF